MAESVNGGSNTPAQPPKEMSMEVRLLIAFLLMGVVMCVTPCFLKAQVVSLRLKLARELQQAHRNRQLRSLIDAVARPRSLGEDDQRDRRDGCVVAPRHLARGMVGADVRRLMRHHARQFRLLRSEE